MAVFVNMQHAVTQYLACVRTRADPCVDSSPVFMTLDNFNLILFLIPQGICLYGVCNPASGVTRIEECHENRAIIDQG